MKRLSPTLLHSLPIRFEGSRIWLADEDVSDAIRTEEAGMNASKVSAFPAVRAALVDFAAQFPQACRAWLPMAATWARSSSRTPH